MVLFAVQVEPKVKEWDQHLVMCVEKGVRNTVLSAAWEENRKRVLWGLAV